MSTGTDNGNIFSKSDSASMNLGKVPVSQGGMIPAAVGQQILTRLESIQQLMTESTLSQIQLKIYLYGGQLSTGFDFYPSIPEGEQGSAFVGTFGPLSNGTNMVSPYEGAEMCRLGTGLPSSGSLPTSAGNYITLQENTPNALLKDMYPGILNDIDFAFSTQTATGNQVIVGDGLAVDSQEGVYYTPSPAVGMQNTGSVDDFDTFEFQFLHSYAAAYQNGGISQWDDFNKLYAVRVKWDIPWQRNIRCEIDNFMGNDTITVHEWDVNMVWQPNLKHITDMTKIYQGYPSSLPQSTLLPKARQ